MRGELPDVKLLHFCHDEDKLGFVTSVVRSGSEKFAPA